MLYGRGSAAMAGAHQHRNNRAKVILLNRAPSKRDRTRSLSVCCPPLYRILHEVATGTGDPAYAFRSSLNLRRLPCVVRVTVSPLAVLQQPSQCPLWVKGSHSAPVSPMSALRQKRTIPLQYHLSVMAISIVSSCCDVCGDADRRWFEPGH